MQIPEQGQRISFVASAGNEGSAPIIRAGTVTRVVKYSPTECLCNLLVTMDGPNDMQPGFISGNTMGFQVFLENVPFGTEREKSAIGTWYFPTYTNFECHDITTELDIQHGRETIKAGAVGVVDYGTDTITFKEEDIINLGQGVSPTYPAVEFMTLHGARIELSEGYGWVLARAEATDRETPEEREAFMKDLRAQLSDPMYRKLRKSGMPSRYNTESLELAREKRQKARREQSLKDARGTDTRDENALGRSQRLNLDQESRGARPREAVAAR